MKTLYIECKMGAAGDMLMAALYELMHESQKQTFINKMNKLGDSDITVEPGSVVSCGISGTHMYVRIHGEEEEQVYQREQHRQDHHHTHDRNDGHFHTHHTHDHNGGHSHTHHTQDHDDNHSHHHTHSTLGRIETIIDRMDVDSSVKEDAKEVYKRLADAESKAHGCAVEEIHFHEVGSLDAIVDIVGTCYAMYLLAPERIIVSPIHVGSGTVKCAHGYMPVPAPATVNLLENVPIYTGDVQGELCTPTGAALLTHFADVFQELPQIQIERIGYGVGTRQFDRSNCVRAFLGNQSSEQNGEIMEIVCNIDDMTSEALAYACERLIDSGALDVYTVPGTMKKGRPGWVLNVLCEPGRESEIAVNILKETTSNGVRVRKCGKYFLEPRQEKIETIYGAARVKISEGFGVKHVKPEYEDVAKLTRKSGEIFEKISQEIMKKYAE